MVIDECHGREDWRKTIKGFKREEVRQGWIRQEKKGSKERWEKAGEGKQSMEKGKRRKKSR